MYAEIPGEIQPEIRRVAYLIEGVIVIGRFEADKGPNWGGGGEDAVDGVRVLEAEPRGDHPAVRAAKAHDRRVPRLPLIAQSVEQIGEISHGLLRRQVALRRGTHTRERERKRERERCE